MLKKITVFSGAIALSSFSLAMASENSSLVPFNQTGVLVANNYTMQNGKGFVGHPIHNPQSQKSIKRPIDQSSTIEILYEAAARDVRIRDFNAQRISEALNKNYVGVGDQYSWMRQVRSDWNIHGTGRVSSEEIVAELNQVCKDCPLDRSVIIRTREINTRFKDLLNDLEREKKGKFWRLFEQHPREAHLNPWVIDSFFDEKFPCAELHSDLQHYVQEEIEKIYKKQFSLSYDDDRNAIKEHAIKHSLQYATAWHRRSIEWIQGLIRCKTLKSLPKNKQVQLKKELCDNLESICSRADITYKEGKYCDGDEFKQECK